MDDQAENERAIVGHNQPPDPVPMLLVRLEGEYKFRVQNVERLLIQARALPQRIDDDDQLGITSKIVKDIRDEVKALESARQAEKLPHMNAERATDGWFFPLIEKLARRAKLGKAGAVDILQARMDDYNERKVAAERERREQEHRERERIAREAREKAEREQREAEEARRAAERARKPETVEAKSVMAGAAADLAAMARAEADLATHREHEARISTFAKPADMARVRTEEGPLVTATPIGYADVLDFDELNNNPHIGVKLWPFVSQSAKEAAVRAFAKATDYNEQIPGASIGKKLKTVVR